MISMYKRNQQHCSWCRTNIQATFT